MKHLSKILVLFVIIGIGFFFNEQRLEKKSVKNGQVVFERNCVSCHGISSGNIGPKLGGVHASRSIEELYDFVKNPSKFINNGDFRTSLLFKKYKTEMPSFKHLKAEEIKDIFNYIKHQTEYLKEAPLSVNELIPPKNNKRYAPAVKSSSVYIELEDFVQFPKLPNTPPDKGIATLRNLPNRKNEFYVSDQMGIIYRVLNKKIAPFFDIRPYKKNFIYTPGIGTGLGSFDFHPDFATNGLFYTTHAEKYLNKPAINSKVWADSIGVGLQWVITEWQLDKPGSFPFRVKNREVLRFNTPTTAHGGQDLNFVPNIPKTHQDYGLLYLGIGDGGSNNIKLPELCHSPKSLLGTIIRINPRGKNGVLDSYGIPIDNPFAKNTEKGVQKEIFAYGFRNPHRITWHEDKMLVADVGEANVEELNLVKNGGDYGWANQEGYYGISTKKDKTKVYEISAADKMKYILPIAQYDHNDGNAISGGFVYRGSIKALVNKYVFGDIVTGRLFYIDLNKFSSENQIFEINIVINGSKTSLRDILNEKRIHLRLGYDSNSGDLFIMTKPDRKLRRVINAYNK